VYSVFEKNHRQYNDHKNKDKGTSSWFVCIRFFILFSEAIQPCSIKSCWSCIRYGYASQSTKWKFIILFNLIYNITSLIWEMVSYAIVFYSKTISQSCHNYLRLTYRHGLGDHSRFWWSCLGPLVYLLPKSKTNYLAFQFFDIERTWWGLYQKRVVPTKFDIFVLF
jgi:hypothetical protein